MLDIERVDHIGIRVSDKAASVAFYERLGFRLVADAGFDKGHPVIMQHSAGPVVNLLGPADKRPDANVLMDVDARHAGITHVSYRVRSIDAAKAFLARESIPLTGEFRFKDLHAIFIRDPDLNVIELDGYAGEQPETRIDDGYADHP